MRILMIILAAVWLGGCAKLAHLKELLTLKTLSENQAEQKKYIDRQNKKFEGLLIAVNNNELAKYPDKKSILKEFGEPILTKTVFEDEEVREEWLYRYSAKLSGSEKVYLYFDVTGRLVNWKDVLPEVQNKKPATQGG